MNLYMSRRVFTRYVPVIVVLAVLSAAFLLSRRGVRGITVTVCPVRSGVVESTVVSSRSGTVISRADSTLMAEHFGRVAAIRLDEGDRAHAGDVIIELDSRERRAQLALAEANLRAGNARLSQTRTAARIQDSVSQTDVEQARARFENAKSEFARIETLRKEGIATTAQYDNAALTLDLAREALDAAETTLEQSAVRQEEIRAAEASVEQLQAAVEIARTALDKCFIRAPFDGMVANVFVEVGESVGQSTSFGTSFAPMCRIVDDSQLIVEAPVDEADIGSVALGQTAYVNFDAFPGESARGTVSFISPVVDTALEQNRTVTVEVSLDRKEGTGPGDQPYKVGMSVVEHGRLARRDIEIGLENWDISEITAGLGSSDQVVVSLDVAELAPGVRVRQTSTESPVRTIATQ